VITHRRSYQGKADPAHRRITFYDSAGRRRAPTTSLIATAHRAQADALEIEAAAKRRLADEYDAAQERGEVRTRAHNQHASSGTEEAVSVADIGLTHKDIHEAR
jgi:hypothetical protein